MRKQHLLLVFVLTVAVIILFTPISAEPNFFCISVRANPIGEGRYNIIASGSSPFWSIRSLSEEVVAGPQTSGTFSGIFLGEGTYIVYLANASQGPWYSTNCQFSISSPPTSTPTTTSTASATLKPAPTNTRTATSTQTVTSSPTKTSSPFVFRSSTPTVTPTLTESPTSTKLLTVSPAASTSASATRTISTTATLTPTPTPTWLTRTPTVTASPTITGVITVTSTKELSGLLVITPTAKLVTRTNQSSATLIPEVPNVGAVREVVGIEMPLVFFVLSVVFLFGISRAKLLLIPTAVTALFGALFVCGFIVSLFVSMEITKVENTASSFFVEEEEDAAVLPTKFAIGLTPEPNFNDRISQLEVRASSFRIRTDRIEQSFGWCFRDEVKRLKIVKGACPSGTSGTYAWDIPGEKGKIIIGKIDNDAYPFVLGDTIPVFGGHFRSVDDAFGHSFLGLEGVVSGDKLTLFSESGNRFEYEYFASKFYPVTDKDLKRFVFGDLIPTEIRAEKKDLVLTFTCAGEAKDGRFSHRLLIYWKRQK